MKTLNIQGRRWFQKTYGNTYHSSRIYVDGKSIGGVSFAYGYGNHYLTTAEELLQVGGHIPTDKCNTQALWSWCEENGVHLEYSVVDVDRKRDL